MELYTKWKNIIGPEGDRERILILIRMTFTIALQKIGEVLIFPISAAFVGSLGEDELAAISLAISICYAAMHGVFYGLSTGFDAFFAQAFGSGQKKLFGRLVIRGLILQWFITSLLMPFYLNMEYLLVLFGQNPHIARMTGSYFLWLSPFIYMVQVHIVLLKCLSCQNRDILGFVLSSGCIPFTSLAIYIFVDKLGGSVWSGGCSVGLTYTFLGLSALLGIVRDSAFSTFWPGLTWDIFDDFWHFSKHCLNGMVVMFIDWGTLNAVIMFSGYIGSVALAAQGVFESLYMILITVSFGMCTAASIQVGQAVGAMNPDRAARISRISFVITNLYGIIVFPLLISLRSVLPKFFTSSENVISVVKSLMPFLGMILLLDSILNIGRGINRGTGNLTMSLVVGMIGYVLLGLPLSVFLMLKTSLGIKGGWIGLSSAMAVCGLFYIIYYCCYAKWEDIVVKATEKTKMFKSETDENYGSQDKVLLQVDTSENADENGKISKLRGIGIALILATLFFPIIGVVIRCTLPIPTNTASHQNSSIEISTYSPPVAF